MDDPANRAVGRLRQAIALISVSAQLEALMTSRNKLILDSVTEMDAGKEKPRRRNLVFLKGK